MNGCVAGGVEDVRDVLGIDCHTFTRIVEYNHELLCVLNFLRSAYLHLLRHIYGNIGSINRPSAK